jgi:drug/metabolite transporter (DMT)-like permease
MGELLALLTALLHAIGVILYKRAVAFVTPFGLNLFKNCVALVMFVSTAVFLNTTDVSSISAKDFALMLVSGAVGIGISDTLLFMTLSRLGASRTALVDCLYSPSIILLSYLLWNETLSVLVFLGGVLILGGVVVSSSSAFGGGLSRRQFWIGCGLGALSMLTVAFAVVMIEPLLDVYPLTLLIAIRMAGGVAILVLLAPFSSQRKSVYGVFRPQQAWKFMFWGTFFGSYLSLFCWLAGFKYAKAGVVALLNQTSTILIVVFAALFLKEPLTRLKVLAVIMAVIGAVLVLSSSQF